MAGKKVWGIWNKEKKKWSLGAHCFFGTRKQAQNYIEILGWGLCEIRSCYLPTPIRKKGGPK